MTKALLLCSLLFLNSCTATKICKNTAKPNVSHQSRSLFSIDKNQQSTPQVNQHPLVAWCIRYKYEFGGSVILGFFLGRFSKK